MAEQRVSDEVRMAAACYSDMLLERLLLQDWQVRVVNEPPDDDECVADIQTRKFTKRGDFRLSDDFMDLDAHEKTVTLIHEHVHLHFEMMRDYVEDAVAANIRGKLGAHISEQFTTLLEVGIDQLAYALAGLLPQFELPAN